MQGYDDAVTYTACEYRLLTEVNGYDEHCNELEPSSFMTERRWTYGGFTRNRGVALKGEDHWQIFRQQVHRKGFDGTCA